MNTQTAITTAMAAQSAQSPASPHRRITARTVCDLCGGVSDMTLHRWLKDPEKDFPRPVYIGNRRYWREADVVAWLEARGDAA